VTISLPTASFTVDLGALVVKATSPTVADKPTFGGHLLIDVADDGSFSFAFGPGSGFHAR